MNFLKQWWHNIKLLSVVVFIASVAAAILAAVVLVILRTTQDLPFWAFAIVAIVATVLVGSLIFTVFERR